MLSLQDKDLVNFMTEIRLTEKLGTKKTLCKGDMIIDGATMKSFKSEKKAQKE